MKKLFIMAFPFIVIIACVLCYNIGLKRTLSTFGTTFFEVVPLAFVLSKWIVFVETNIKD